MKNDAHPQAHQRPFNGTGAWLRMKPERRVQRCGPGRVVAGGVSRGQDLQKKPQLSLGAKSDLQSAPESTRLMVLRVGRGAFIEEREKAMSWGDCHIGGQGSGFLVWKMWESDRLPPALIV